MIHFLIIEDHEDVFENVSRKLNEKYPNSKIHVATNCDEGFRYIKYNKNSEPVELLIVDLMFANSNVNTQLKNGNQLLAKLIEEGIKTPKLVYSSNDSMEKIYPVMNNYKPEGFVIKTHISSKELLFAIDRLLQGETYYSQKIHSEQKKRIAYKFEIDEIDEKIINLLPEINAIVEWENRIEFSSGYMSYTSIKKRIDKLCDVLEVDNEKQLLLKLKDLAFL